MKLKVDKESDALYFRLDDAEIIESEEVQPGVILDFDKDGRVIGFEILSGIEDDLRPEYDLKQLLQGGVKGKYAERCKIQAVVYPGDESGYVAECLDLAVVTQGKTLKETVENLQEAIQLHIERDDPDMLDDYDFSQGVRGKYVERFAQGSNIVVLSPEMAKIFPDSESVNRALQLLVEIASKSVGQASVG